jgi:hypothetical protein
MNLRKVFSRYRKQRDQFILNFRKTTRPESREIISMKRPTIFGIFLLLPLGGAAFTHAQAPTRDLRSLQGTWVMEAAYEISADGTRATHFGKVSIDRAKHQLDFDLEAASFPNWDGKRQVRDYTFKDGVLSYAVPASAYGGGTVAYSVWRRVGS